jgi:hypothetical protein
MNMDYVHQIQSVHEVKVALCYLLVKIGVPITETDLYGIVFDTEFINYFLYSAAIEELIINDSIARVKIDGTDYIELREKGIQAAELLKKNVQFRFRKHLLEAAYKYNFEREVKNTVEIEITKLPKGYDVTATLDGKHLRLMKLSLYAPDEDQAEFLSFQIRENPIEFYRTIINTLTMNKRPELVIDEEKV